MEGLSNKPAKFFPKQALDGGPMLWIKGVRLHLNITVDCERCDRMVLFDNIQPTAIGVQKKCECGRIIRIQTYREE